jgi:multiple sugar transport system substrate-binding protein
MKEEAMEGGAIKRLSRRQVLRGAAAGLAGLVAVPLLEACGGTPAPTATTGTGATGTPAPAQTGGKKAQLRVLQWSHFVPAYDEWYDKFVKDWGAKNNAEVVVDHLPHLEMPARFAAEVAAKAGHDLFEFAGQVLTYRYTEQLVEMKDLVDYATGKWGDVEPIGKKLAVVKDKWVGLPNFYIMIAPFVRKDLFQEVGYDWTKVETWDQYLEVGRKLKAKGNPAGLAISHCNDANHNWRAIMWSFGASEVGEDGKTVTVDSKEMRDFLTFAKQFHQEANTPEVFAWDDAADNRWLASGVGGYINDALSSYRSIEGQNKELFDKLAIAPTVKGPKVQISMPDSNVYAIWSFTPKENQDAAKSFLKYYVDNYKEAFVQSTGYNMPMYDKMFQRPMPIVGENDRLKIIQEYRGKVIDTFGHPGPPTAEATLVLQQYIVPDMVGIAVRGGSGDSVGEAIKFAKEKLAAIYK